MDPIELRLLALGLTLPEPMRLPEGMSFSFPEVLVAGERALISGHGPLAPDGSVAYPLGRVGENVSIEEAQQSARLTALSMLSSLKRALGRLDRVVGWLKVFGMVNATPDFARHPLVINAFSDLILSVYGPTCGRHARSAIGVASLPFNMPVEIEAEVRIIPA